MLIICSLATVLFLLATDQSKCQQEQPQQQSPDQHPTMIGQPLTPILTGGRGESYIVLTDDELVQNADMLRHLALATKEEVEEIVEGNPALQEAMLSKIRKIVKMKEKAAHLMEHHHHEHDSVPVDGSVEQIQQQEEYDYDQVHDDFDDPEFIAGQKINLIKTKIKTNAAKLFKIGSHLRGGLKRLRKKKVHHKHRFPHFHFNVSTSSHKESPDIEQQQIQQEQQQQIE